jgi:hypothetical protein
MIRPALRRVAGFLGVAAVVRLGAAAVVRFGAVAAARLGVAGILGI